MYFKRKEAQLVVPDRVAEDRALSRTTHLAIGAHADDLEIMAIDGILKTYQKEDQWFCGVVVTDGNGPSEAESSQIRAIRKAEQEKAAHIGEYGSLVWLDYPSRIVKKRDDPDLSRDLLRIIKATGPEIVYTHNPVDKHETHVAVALRVIEALRLVPDDLKPSRVYGCEVWRDLDWLPDREKVVFDVSARPDLQRELLNVFASQINDHKRYDLAAIARRNSHAVFFDPRQPDRASALAYALDLTPLLHDAKLSVDRYVRELIGRFSAEVSESIHRMESSTLFA